MCLIPSSAKGHDNSPSGVVGGMERDGAPRGTPLSGWYPVTASLSARFLISQVSGEANPSNMVTKLSQLTSLLSSIEDKVCGGSCSFSGLLLGPLMAVRTLCSL